MLATDPDQKPRRRRPKACTFCDASAVGCDTLRWLRGTSCCSRCSGDHDHEGGPDAA